MINPLDLTGKQIIVAGAASETGKIIVSQLCKLGAKVLMVDVSEEDLAQIQKNSKIGAMDFYAFDIYNDLEIEPNFKKITDIHGSFQGFVYCAGTGGVRPIQFTKHSFLSKMMNDNFYSFIEMVRCITKKKSFSQSLKKKR